MASIRKRKHSQSYYMVYWDVTQKQIWKALPGLTRRQAEAVAKRKTQEIAEQRRRLKSMALHFAQLEDARGAPLDGVFSPMEVEDIRRVDMAAQGYAFVSDEDERAMEQEALRQRLGVKQVTEHPAELSIEHLLEVVLPGWQQDGLFGKVRITTYSTVLRALRDESDGKIKNLDAIQPHHGDGIAKLLKKKKGRSSGTVESYMKALRAIFSTLIKQRLYDKVNPISWDRRITPPNPMDTSVPTSQEMEEMLVTIKSLDESIYQGVYLMQSNGLRIGEVCSLRWENRSNDVIYVRNSKTSKAGEEHRDRGVHVQDIADAGIPVRTSGPVIRNPSTNLAYNTGQFRRRLYACLDKTPMGRVNPHKFRHFFGTNMAIKGANRHQIQAAMGHSSSTMSDRYVHIKGSIRDIREMVDKKGS